MIKVEMRFGSTFIGLSHYRAIEYRHENDRLGCFLCTDSNHKNQFFALFFESAVMTILCWRPSQRRIRFSHENLKWSYFRPCKMGPDESRRETKTRKNSSGLDATHQTVSFSDSGLLALLAILG